MVSFAEDIENLPNSFNFPSIPDDIENRQYFIDLTLSLEKAYREISNAINLKLKPPIFLAKNTAAQNNIAINTVVNVILGTEIIDIGSNFASSVFTAPETGEYQLNAILYLSQIDTAATYYQILLVTSNRSYQDLFNPLMSADYKDVRAISTVADMDKGDLAYLTLLQSGGTQQTDISSVYFSGFLIK